MKPSENPLLDADLLMEERGGGVIGRRTVVFRETISTNDLLLQMGEDGEPEGTAVFALMQTGGRGRLGRKWNSGPGLGLWFSFLLRPQFHPGLSAELTAFTSLAVHQTCVSGYGLDAHIKPPNDIYLGSRKIAGILTETRIGKTNFAVIGIGLNVLHEAEDFPPDLREKSTSIHCETRDAVRLPEVAILILQNLNAYYFRLMRDAGGVLLDYEKETKRFHSVNA